MLTIFVSSILLMAINFYSLRAMSSVRAYINGESNYSKGEKNASLSLMAYIHSENEQDWTDFLNYIKIPLGDSLARVTLLANGPKEVVKKGFIQGRNHEEDVNNMIWLFKTFKDMPLMARPILIWEKGDSLIHQKILIANQIRASIHDETLETKKEEFLLALSENSMAVTRREMQFSARLGEAAREITNYLFYANTIIIFLILGSVCIYVVSMLRRLNEQNAALASANKELDLITHSISHDLRAPINSMMGLVNLVQLESDPEKQKTYVSMLQRTLNKQEKFIKEVVELSKESRQHVKSQIVELDFLVEQVINTHKHMSAAQDMKFIKHMGIHKLFTDPHRLEIILNNLVSNAIKYHDPSKSDKFIEIKTYSGNDKIHIEVTDNGLGIHEKDISKIFDMYYMSTDREKGTGLGLYIVKEAIAKLEGRIEVKSVKGNGTTFTVILNK